MSAFLGSIHSWLFRKIEFQDELTMSIIESFEDTPYISKIKDNMDQTLSCLERGNLTDIIDETNIHGWLQERVSLVENRLAFVVTRLIEIDAKNIARIKESAYSFGKKHAPESLLSVKDAFAYLENILLNGMPCDHVNAIISEDEESITWKQTVDIHEPYWANMNGAVQNYDIIRESVIAGILYQRGISFSKKENQIFELKKNERG